MLPMHAEVNINAPCMEYDRPDEIRVDVMMVLQAVLHQKYHWLNYQAIHCLDLLNWMVVVAMLLLQLLLLRPHDVMRCEIVILKMMYH